MAFKRKRGKVTVNFNTEQLPSLDGYTKISQSRVNKWRQCRYAHHLAFNEKIEKKKPPAPLYKGKILHELIEARINGENWEDVVEPYLEEFDKMFEEEKEMYGDLRKDIPTIMKGYDKLYEDEDLEYMELNGKKAEHDFAIEVAPNIAFVGKIDTVAKDSRDRVWLMEHKSFKKAIPDESFRWTNQQATLYSWVMPKIGFPFPTGVIWDYLRSKTPTEPQVLKSGGISKARKIDTTYETYYNAIVANGEDPDDYGDFLEELKGRENNFYRRIYLPTRKNIVDTVVKDFTDTAKEIRILGDHSKTRNLGRHCSFCQFKQICQVELMGGDSDYVKKAEYRPSTYHLNVEEGEDD